MDLEEHDRAYLVKERSYTDVSDDHAIEAGNIASSSSRSQPLTENINHGVGDIRPEQKDKLQKNREQWLMNYQEASIYLEEGRNNEKFDTHPRSQSALPAYLIAHHTFFHVLDILASLLLLFLAVIEPPSVDKIHVPILLLCLMSFAQVHASLEVMGILILTLDLIFKARWQGIKAFFTHKRSLMKCVLLLVMVTEAITVIIRLESHFRVTRALRPLFLLDTYYCRGIRRFWRQLLQSLPPICEFLFLLLFVMLLFSILGFYLFSANENSVYFATLEDSFISLFVLLTTANYPDVMMPAYATSPFAAIFFIIYIAIELYFFMNLFLAVVYNTFTTLEKSKVKKLWLHKRHACEHSFRLLVSRKHPNAISLRHFSGLMAFYKPRAKKDATYLVFKTLNESKTGSLTLNEFYNIYSICGLQWKETSESDLWFQKLPYKLSRAMNLIHRLVNLKWFEWFIYLVISGNFAVILYEAINASIEVSKGEINLHQHPYQHVHIQGLSATWYSIMFTVIYILEVILKILGLGPKKYFTDGWNLFDLTVTLVSIAGLFGDLFKDDFFFFSILRPLRLIRIFKARKRYRDVLGTLFILADRLWSLVITLVLLYYFYAIIGMECFSQIDMVDCCQNKTAIAPYYANNSGYYYLNNFEDIFKSGVTLFELTVVNNWFIIMEGYAYMDTEYSRIYFMTFYIITMVVMTVVVAFILEAFMFKIEYRNTTHDNSTIDYLIHSQSLSLEEVHMINNMKMQFWSGQVMRMQSEAIHTDLHFIGKKKRGKIELSLQMYKDEIEEWIAEEDNSSLSSLQQDESFPPPDVVLTAGESSLSRLSTVSSASSLSDMPFVIGREDDILTNQGHRSGII